MDNDNFLITAKTFHGLEKVLANELKNLGAKNIKVLKRAITFRGDKELLYKSNLHLRTALRILVPVHNFKASSDEELYEKIKSFRWEKYMNVDTTFAVDSTVNSNFFTHSKYAALKVKDGIVDRFRDKKGLRPNVDIKEPKLLVNLYINNNDCTVSLDSSGDSLHKRGYRVSQNTAPLNEVLAAGLILLSEWDGKSPLIDPMCGSGTIPIEAALFAHKIPPGMIRKNFGFTRWRDFDSKLWLKLLKEAKRNIDGKKPEIYGSDFSSSFINIAERNTEKAGLQKLINLKVSPFEKLEAPGSEGTIIMNPPYGERMKKDDIFGFYTAIGDKLKQSFTGYDAWILSGNKDALKKLGLRTSRRITLFNGPIEVKFHKYELYRGSKKQKYRDE